MNADQAVIQKAIEVITNALHEHELPALESGMAMLAILKTLSTEGLDIYCEETKQS